MKWIITLLTSCTFLFSCGKGGTEVVTQPAPTDSLGGWQKITPNIGKALDIVFVSAAKGYIANSSGLYQSSDSGKTWAFMPGVGNGSISTINFMNPQNGYFVGNRYGFTTNSGTNWTTLNTNSSGMDVFFTNTNTGCLAGYNGIERTTDTGRTWIRVLNEIASSIYFPDANNGWAGGRNKIFKTTNGGMNWTPNYADQFGEVMAIQFVSLNNGWFTGMGNNAVYRTTDGGSNWQRVAINGSAYDLHFIDNSLGYVVTRQGRILKSTDGGNTWLQDAKLVDSDFIEVFFLDANHGWAVTTSGTLMRWKR